MQSSENRVQTSRHIDSNLHALYRHPTLERFLQANLKPGVHSIWYGGLPIDLQLTIKESETLVIVLHGAVLTDIKLPWLSGTGITQGVNVSRLSIADPSLYLGQGLTLSWYAGNQYQPDLQSTLLKIFEKVAESLSIERIVFLGGSGGGFASLVFSHAIARSTALVFNPQTNIEKYDERFVKKWLSVAWGLDRLDDLPDSVIRDVNPLYGQGFRNQVVYMQNETDSHLHTHMQPLVQGIRNLQSDQLQGGYQQLIQEWAKGHTPPPKELIQSTLKAVIEGPSRLVDDFERLL